jgi:hypothetical protein
VTIEWYVRRGADQWGPITQQEFEKLEGALEQGDFLWRSDWQEWRPYQSAPPAWNGEASDLTEADRVTPEEFIQTLIADDLTKRGVPLEAKARVQYAIVLEELMRSIVPRVRAQPRWQEDMRTRYDQFSSMVENFGYATNARLSGHEWLAVLWRHRDLLRAFKEGTESREGCEDVEKHALSEIALEYLKHDARSGEFDRLLVDALVARETYSFGEEIKKTPSRFEGKRSFNSLWRDVEEWKLYDDAKGDLEKLFWLRLKERAKISGAKLLFLVGLPIAGIVVGLLPMVCAAFLALVVSFYLVRGSLRIISRLFWREQTGTQKLTQLFGKMVTAYNEIQGPATSPTRCREALAKVADDGAAWDPSVFAILDGAIQRSAGRWV